MEKSTKTNRKQSGISAKVLVALTISALLFFVVTSYINRQEQEEIKRKADEKLQRIHERIEEIINSNDDIYNIETYFEYDGINFIQLYVYDTWFYSTDVQKKRFASDVQIEVRSILFEEGFIKIDDRLGIYVYSTDGIDLAESGMDGQIKLKN